MSKKLTSVQLKTKKIISEIKLGLHLMMDREMEMRMEQFIGSNLLSIYYEGYSDGLQKARELVFPILQKKEEK